MSKFGLLTWVVAFAKLYLGYPILSDAIELPGATHFIRVTRLMFDEPMNQYFLNAARGQVNSEDAVRNLALLGIKASTFVAYSQGGRKP